MKRGKRMFLCLLGLFLAIYIGWGCAMGHQVQSMVRTSNQVLGAPANNKCNVSDGIFQQMSYRGRHLTGLQDRQISKETDKLSFPLAVHWFTGGKAVYWYTYELYNTEGELVCGSWRVPVTVSVALDRDGFRVTEYFEAP